MQCMILINRALSSLEKKKRQHTLDIWPYSKSENMVVHIYIFTELTRTKVKVSYFIVYIILYTYTMGLYSIKK